MTGPKPTLRLGREVRRLRLNLGISIRQVAKSAGVDATWLSRLERGDYASPDPRSLRNVARVLMITPWQLFEAAGFEPSLPQFGPYLRAKFDLPEVAIAQLEEHLRLINERSGTGSAGDQ